MKRCTSCTKLWPDNIAFCPLDGTVLVADPNTAHGGDPLVGMVLDGKYRLEEKIGQGGMGKVYKGRHLQMDAVVAIKLLKDSLVADEAAVERFRREAASAARIRHPNVVSVTDFGVANGTVYLVMEYLEGHDLREKLRRMGTIPPEIAVRLIAEVCEALDKAHRRGLIHRDLKPDNIWLVVDEETQTEHVKVLDFGIAKLKTPTNSLSALTQRGTIVGTPFYMSPEQCRGDELDARSDIYSLGIILYEILTGEVPFRGDQPLDVAVKHLTQPPRPIRELNRSCPAALEAVVFKALEKKCEDRQPGARQLVAELLEALRVGKPMGGTLAGVPALPVAGVPPVDVGTRRHSAPASTVAYSTPHTPGQPVDSGARTREMSSEEVSLPSGHQPALRRPAVLAAIAAAAALTLTTVVVVVVLLQRMAPSAAPETNGNAGVAAPRSEPPAQIAGMVYIPGGTFTMGTDDPAANPLDKPAHPVTVPPFYIDEHEVTNAEYRRFMEADRYPAPSDWVQGQYAPGTDDLPVTHVTWTDAKAYATWAGKRLPTEEEWEFAARGPQNLRYPWGNTWVSGNANSKEAKRDGAARVGAFANDRSSFGVLDLAGNVSEWVSDDFKPYEKSDAPLAGLKIIRGGTFVMDADFLLCWRRYSQRPDFHHATLGFRCAKTPTGDGKD